MYGQYSRAGYDGARTVYIFYICFQEFNHAQKHWTEDFSIGAVYLKYADALLKAYPPYVNFYQDSKEMLKKCEKEPRFYAFLRVCQSKPESGRQHLADLMMHPIQVNLNNNNTYILFKELLKQCSKNAQKCNNLIFLRLQGLQL